MKFQPPRGTNDLFENELLKQEFIYQRATHLCQLYNYKPISTPLFELTEVFNRSLGLQTDVVSKQMYTFLDKGEQSLTLRPEGTAGVIRAFLSEKLERALPLKLFYKGAMFRYERPQKGRLRQFHQFGVEHLGDESPYSDVESIALAYEVLKSLKCDHKLTLQINSLGNKEERGEYEKALISTLNKKREKLSKISQVRLEKNPLRILDSKESENIKILKDIPLLQDFLKEKSREFFNHILKGLKAFNIPYTLNPHLVRGLDYYEHTVFEFVTDEAQGQNAVLSGGRYSDLSSLLGGGNMPCIGWSLGVERLSELINDLPHSHATVALLPFDEEGHFEAQSLCYKLRQKDIKAELFLKGSFKKNIVKVAKKKIPYALILGSKELKTKQYSLKTMASETQESLTLDEIIEKLQKKLTS